MLNPSNRKWLPPQMPLQLSSTSKFHNFYVPALNVNKTTISLNNDYKNCIYSNHVKIDSNALLSWKSWKNCVKLTTFLSNNALWSISYGPYDTVHMIWSIWANVYLESFILEKLCNLSKCTFLYGPYHMVHLSYIRYMLYNKTVILIALQYTFDLTTLIRSTNWNVRANYWRSFFKFWSQKLFNWQLR